VSNVDYKFANVRVFRLTAASRAKLKAKRQSVKRSSPVQAKNKDGDATNSGSLSPVANQLKKVKASLQQERNDGWLQLHEQFDVRGRLWSALL